MTNSISKERYFELLFTNKEEEHHLATLLIEKHNILPKKLYRYRPINGFLQDTLENDIAFLSSALNFNDPYDSGLTVSYSQNIEEYVREMVLEDFCKSTLQYFDNKNFDDYLNEIKMTLSDVSLDYLGFVLGGSFSQEPMIKARNIEVISNKIHSALNELKSIQNDFIGKLSVIFQSKIYAACFTECHDNILMWSHYAQNHEGICIEYDFNSLPIPSLIVDRLSPVKYTDKLFNKDDYLLKDPINIATLASLSKYECWSYEKEWRIISPLIEEQYFQLNKPTAVIFGTKTPQDDKVWISEICQKRGIPIKQAELDRTEYKLHIKETPIVSPV